MSRKENEQVSLGPSPEGKESYDVTAEWSEEYNSVYLEDWDPYEGHILQFFALSPTQMELLVQWWRNRVAATLPKGKED